MDPVALLAVASRRMACPGLAAFAVLLALHAPPGFAQPPFFFEGDMVTGRPPAGVKAPVCVLASQFRRNETVVWRVRVLDAASGQALDDKTLKTVHVELPDGQKFPMKFGPHPPKGQPADHFWAISWRIPADYPTGTLSYTVSAVDQQGRSATWQPFRMAPSQLTVVP
ncbi:MAG TPA: hypothetical protein VFC18_18260 [Burkholderiales bacterium]|nr:hypothetical protein [Burkholderiales bacterium]